MSVNRIGAAARRLLPGSAFSLVRRIGTAALTPFVFSLRTGHWRSSLRAKALSPDGQAIPWYTYPAFDFLSGKDFSGRLVLEWGGGQSTLWWASRADGVITFESDVDWFKQLEKIRPPNVELHHVPDNLTGADELLRGASFDVIIIDGLDRALCAERSVGLLRKGGAIIVDNSEGYWGPPGEYPIIDLLRSRGFLRVDFFGHAPGVVQPHCTSLFFQGGSFLLDGREPPRRESV